MKERLDDRDSQLAAMSTFVTPEMFGAVGNGITDDSIAINEAIQYANQSDACKKYYFLNKTYYINNPIDLTNCKGISIDSTAGTTRMEQGATLIEVASSVGIKLNNTKSCVIKNISLHKYVLESDTIGVL